MLFQYLVRYKVSGHTSVIVKLVSSTLLCDSVNAYTPSAGVESFEMALEHWYEASEYVMTQQAQSGPQGENSLFIFEADAKLSALIGGSRKLRRVIEQYDLAETSLPRTPSNMLTWIDEESLQEQLQREMSRDLDEDNSSDTESFVSASDNAQLEVVVSYFFTCLHCTTLHHTVFVRNCVATHCLWF